MKVETAVIADAGTATRLFPETTAVPKGLMPIYAGEVARPLIDYIVEDCAKAGIENIVFVTTEDGEAALKKFYDRKLPAKLHEQLEWLGKKAIIEQERERREAWGLTYEYVHQQPGKYGTAVPLFLARKAVDESTHFAFIAGDDFVYHADGTSEFTQAIRAWESSEAEHLLMGNPVEPEKAVAYGILHTDERSMLSRFAEKPPLHEVPAHPVANISKYLFSNSIWPYITQEMEQKRGDAEHYITYPINEALQAGHSFFMHTITGKYLDGGSAQGLLEASNYITAHPRR